MAREIRGRYEEEKEVTNKRIVRKAVGMRAEVPVGQKHGAVPCIIPVCTIHTAKPETDANRELAITRGNSTEKDTKRSQRATGIGLGRGLEAGEWKHGELSVIVWPLWIEAFLRLLPLSLPLPKGELVRYF